MAPDITKQNYGGGKPKYELRVAYGDWNNCNLKCSICFVQNSKPSGTNNIKIQDVNFGDITYVRFTGGETFINAVQVQDMENTIRSIESRKEKMRW